MEFDLHTLVLVYSWVARFVHSSTSLTEWDDMLVTELGKPATLTCVDREMMGAVTVNWMRRTVPNGKRKLLLLANERKEFSGDSSMDSMRLADTNFQESGVFSLVFVPKMGDEGLYSCLVKQPNKKQRERVILLAILTATIFPAAAPPHDSILRLVASVSPDQVVGRITWAGPGGRPLRSEVKQQKKTLTKLPRFNKNDDGTYICVLHPEGNSSSATFSFDVHVKADVATVASFTDVTHGPQISTGSVAHEPFPLSCPPVLGDYVLVYWQCLDKKQEMKLVYQYDRWRDSMKTQGNPLLQLAGPPYNSRAGSFSFLLSPAVKDGGLYICEVFFNDECYSQRTMLSVLKVRAGPSSTSLSLNLFCQYSGRSQVQQVGWSHQNLSRKLHRFSPSPGLLITNISLPISTDTAGNYTCTMRLKNGQAIWAVYTVPLPPKENTGVTAPSLLPRSLSALLLLVPLVAAAVGVLLWRQRHISQRGIEQSLSHHSWEAENIYENPEDMRLTSPQGSVYMDLKPGGGDDVYKELDQ